MAQGKLVSIKGSVREQGTKAKISGAVVQLLKNGSQERKVVTPNSGSYEFELAYDNIYTITYSKSGYVTKRLEVNTKDVPADDKEKGWHKMNVDMTLFQKIDGLDVSILKKPIGKFKFNSTKKEFAHDPAYTASIKNKLSELMANYEKKKKEEDEKLKKEKEKNKGKELDERKFKILMSKGDEAFTARDYGKSIDSYQAAVAIKPDNVIAKNKLEKAKQKENDRLRKIEEAKKNLKSNNTAKTTKTNSPPPKKVVTNTPPPKQESKTRSLESFQEARAREKEELRRKREEERAQKAADEKSRLEARERELAELRKEKEASASNFSSQKEKERELMRNKIEEENKRKEQERIKFEKTKQEELAALNEERAEQKKREEEERRRKIAELEADRVEGGSTNNWDDDLGEKVNKSATQVEIDMRSNLEKEQIDNYDSIKNYQDQLTKKYEEREETYYASRSQQYDSISAEKKKAEKFQNDNVDKLRDKAKEYEKYRKEIIEQNKAKGEQSKIERELTAKEVKKLKEEREEQEKLAYEKNNENYKSFEAYKKGIREVEEERGVNAGKKRAGAYEEINKSKEQGNNVAGEEAINRHKNSYKELDEYKKELNQTESAKRNSYVERSRNAVKDIEESKDEYSKKQNNSELIQKKNKDLYAEQEKMIELEKEREELRKKRAKEYLEKSEELKKAKKQDTQFEGNELSAKYPEGVTEEVYEQKNEAGVIVKTTIRRIVVRGKHGDEYRKVIAKWGVSYFKNGRGVSETVWSTETSKNKIN